MSAAKSITLSHVRGSDMADHPHHKWESRFLDMAMLVASWSKDPSTKVGAVLVSDRSVLGLGYNGFPKGCSDDPLLYEDREEKYRRVVHAEVNALLNAQGETGSGNLDLFTTLCPCSSCAAMIINFGVKRVFSPKPTLDQLSRWGSSFMSTEMMFQEAKVKMIFLPH